MPKFNNNLLVLLMGFLLPLLRSTVGFSTTSSPSASSSSPSLLSSSFNDDNFKLIKPNHIHTIERGGVVVIPNWLPTDLIRRMRSDAKQLFAEGYFTPDGLTNTALGKGSDKQGFTANADRQTFRGGDGWDDKNAGDFMVRQEFASRMKNLREELSIGLNRPSLKSEGQRKHEMTYNWYEPGAKLGRHLDEHHEETKGAKGWQLPTRRSVTWLVYLNENWQLEEGGALHTFPRESLSKTPVGAHDGNLQVGWIHHNCPVFLDSWRPSGQTALYILRGKGDDNKNDDNSQEQEEREYVSMKDFDVPRQPVEFNKFLMPIYQKSFEQISTSRLDPRFVNNNAAVAANMVAAAKTNDISNDSEVHTLDVLPAAGTLVLFDSVTLPHLVKEVTGNRRRIAATGWFHEDSQGLQFL